MKPQVKLGLYVAAVLGTLLFGVLFARAWRIANAPASPSSTAQQGAGAATNAPDAGEMTPEQEPVPLRNTTVVAVKGGFARVFLWGFLGVASLVGLGVLVAHDIAQYAADRTAGAMFDDEGEDLPESTYDLVEKAYGEGDYLEAVRLLREYLKENPRAVHAQIRIAEIYEKDLHNPLAAALEYEEVLQHNFEAERKGWSAIHLVNLYNRLGKQDQAVQLMQRIVIEFPNTPAAAKARERLTSAGLEVPEPPPPPPSSSQGEPPSSLPPGFRPK